MLITGRFTTCSQLAREMYIDAAAMTRMVDRLEKRDLIQRHTSDEDRRMFTLQLTDAGVALASKLPAIYVAAREKNFNGLSDEEMGFLKSLLRRILQSGESAEFSKRTPAL